MPATNSTVDHAVHVSALTGSTVDTVTLTGGRSTVMVTNRGAADIYFTCGVGTGATASVPTVGGNECYITQANTAKAVSFVGDTNDPQIAMVKLISSSTPAYSVETF